MKKFFKILWKGLLGLAAAVIVVVCVVMLYGWHEKQNSYYDDFALSDNVTVRYYYVKEEYRLYNRDEGRVVAKDLDQVVTPADGDSLTVYFKDGLRGFLNARTGRVVIPAQYRHAWVFSEGVAAVVDNSGKIGFINADNEVVLPFVYDYYVPQAIDYLFCDGLCVMTDDEGHCGLIDLAGRWAVEPEYDYIWQPKYGKYRMVRQGARYGMLGEHLDLLFPVEYDEADYGSTEADGVMLTRDGVKQQVAFDGTVIEPFVIDYASELYYLQRIAPLVVTDEDGSSTLRTEVAVLSEYLQYRVDDHWGMMHRETGKVILPALYGGIELLSPELVKAELDGGTGGHILFDINGQRVE